MFGDVTQLQAEVLIQNAATMFADRGYVDVRTVYDASATFAGAAAARSAGPEPAEAASDEEGSEGEEGDEGDATDEEEEEDEGDDADGVESAPAEAAEGPAAVPEDDEWVDSLEDGAGSEAQALDRHMALTARRPDGGRVALFLLVNATLSLGVKTVAALAEVVEQRRLAHVVLVSDQKWTHPARMQLLHLSPFSVEHFDCLSLSIVVPRHALVPPHRALSASEAAEVNARYRCGWSKINPDTDPVARYYAWPAGTLVEVTFASRTNGLTTEYKIVAPATS